jgi:hypothetical protein
LGKGIRVKARLHENLISAFKAIQSAGKSASTGGAAGNRSQMTARLGKAEYTLTIRDLGQPDTYSREELVVMLRTIRFEERRTGWKCPEPEVLA